ncbi:hypothetical protein QJS66_10705 [Kocuria rhizophila]|nr:hypothetical protein QJS66_10705 [Kocuria rhizophila]
MLVLRQADDLLPALHAAARGIRTLVITTPHDAAQFRQLLGTTLPALARRSPTPCRSPRTGSPRRSAWAPSTSAMIARASSGRQHLHGPGLGTELRRFHDLQGAAIFGYRVADPSAYGVVGSSSTPPGQAVSI